LNWVGWALSLRGSKTVPEWRKIFAKVGLNPDDIIAPIYIDELVNVPARWTIDQAPQLQKAVHSTSAGGGFAVPSLSHFSPVVLWRWILPRLIAKRVTVRALDAKGDYNLCDVSDCEALQERVEKAANELKIAAARAKRIADGTLGPKEKMADPKVKARCRELWSDRSLSAREVAEKTGVSEPTLYRHFGPRPPKKT